jgi:hypothetical protein
VIHTADIDPGMPGGDRVCSLPQTLVGLDPGSLGFGEVLQAHVAILA